MTQTPPISGPHRPTTHDSFDQKRGRSQSIEGYVESVSKDVEPVVVTSTRSTWAAEAANVVLQRCLGLRIQEMRVSCARVEKRCGIEKCQ